MHLRLIYLGAIERVETGASPRVEIGPYEAGRVFEVELELGASRVIGRRASCDVQIVDESVGQQVARLALRPEGLWVTDLQSGGGSFLRRGVVELQRPDCELLNGDELGIGRLLLRVEFARRSQ